MPTKHRFHGDPERFNVIAEYISKAYGKRVKYIADVAGGQGMLARQLNKNGYQAEVIDPRGWSLVGVPNRPVEYTTDMADYYDLIVGVHPDQALRPVVESAKLGPIIVIPCCNFWDTDRKLGRDALLEEIEQFLHKNKIPSQRVMFDFKGPQNIGIATGF